MDAIILILAWYAYSFLEYADAAKKRRKLSRYDFCALVFRGLLYGVCVFCLFKLYYALCRCA